MAPYVIETVGLTKKFPQVTAVQDLNLQVPKGSLFGFLGPNGSGKSTTMKMLLGLVKPTGGVIRLFGRDLTQHRLEILGKVGSLVEAPSYYEHLTAYENLEITRRLLQLPAQEIDKALELMDLSPWKHQKVKHFSLGMKQRLGIAQALMGNRELLLLDEPTNGLDPAGVKEMRELIKSLPERTQATVLISSHLLSEIELVADHVGIIQKGKLLFQGSMAELKALGRKEILIKADPCPEAAAFLRRRGYPVTAAAGTLSLPSLGIHPAEVNQELVLNGFRVFHLSEKHRNLEDIFLQLTKEAS